MNRPLRTDETTRRWKAVAACLLLIGIVLAVYHPILRNQFVNWDDQNEIYENPDFNPVTFDGLMWNFSHTRLTLYMPVTYLVWGAVARIAPRGTDGVLLPGAFHGLSLILHATAVVLVFCLIRRCLRIRAPGSDPVVAPFAGALVFAVHPIQTEAVAWASGMYTILAAVWSLSAVLCYLKHAQRLTESPGSFNRRWYLLATLFFALAVLTKASSVVVPAIAGAIDVLIVGRPVKRVVMSLWPWVIAGVPVVWAAKSFQDLSTVPAPPPWARPLVAADAIGFYLGKLAWPIHFIPDYGRNPRWVMFQLQGREPGWFGRHLLPVMVMVGVGAMAALAVFAAALDRRRPIAAAGAVIFLAGIGAYLGLTTFDFQYVSTVADRYAYVGMIGIAMGVAAVAAYRPAGVVILCLAVPLAVLSYRQSKIWNTTTTLFDYTLDVNNVSLVARNVRGYLAAKDKSRWEEAEWNYYKALNVWPEDALIHFNLGNLYKGGFRDSPELALEQYELAVQYQPHFAPYQNSLAAMLATRGQMDQAIAHWNLAIADDPRYLDPRNNLGRAYLQLGQAAAARGAFQSVLAIDPGNPTARAGLADVLRQGGGAQ
jgi:Tfp pilus assembly protein PilF